jgi:mannose-6-phosphate isomerase
MECMANSDNVIRAGLTPKLRDIPNLISNLTYDASPASKHVVSPNPFSVSARSDASHTLLYDPPITEFSVLLTRLPPGQEETQRALGGPSIGIVTEGKGRIRSSDGEDVVLGTGEVFFVGAGSSIVVSVPDEANGDLVIFRAFAEA